MSVWRKRMTWIGIGLAVYLCLCILSIPFAFNYGYKPTWLSVILYLLDPLKIFQWSQDNPLLGLLISGLTWSIVTRIIFELLSRGRLLATGSASKM